MIVPTPLLVPQLFTLHYYMSVIIFRFASQ